MINNARNIKLTIQPICITMHHEYVFEGPCRFGPPEHLTAEYDNMVNAERRRKLVEELDRTVGGNVHYDVREPIFVDRTEEFLVGTEMIDTLAKDNESVDVYLLGQMSRMVDVIIPFAQKVKKPIVTVPATARPMHTILPAAMLSRGLEVYAYRTWEETIDMLEVLRVKKILANTRILCASRFGTTRTVSAMDNIIDPEYVTKVLGTQFCYVNPHELIDQTQIKECTDNATTPGRRGLNPTEADIAEINRITDELIAGSQDCTMQREEVFNSVRFNVIVKKFLDHYDCNAFTMPCPDMCATRRLNQERFTPCLNHSLLGEIGIPAACEYDLSAVLTMMILTNFVDAPAYMGNTTHAPYVWKTTGNYQVGSKTNDSVKKEFIEGVLKEDGEDVIYSFHAVPKRNMAGFDAPKAPYALRPFTHSGFGATIRYDFSRDNGTPVTMARIDPACKKLFVARGKVVSGSGYDDTGCSLGIYIQVKDGRDYFNKQIMFGNHIPLVYGDCFDKACQLGKVLGLEVVTA